MAKTNIILSNGDGRVTSTASFAYDNITSELSADNVSINELNMPQLTGNKLLYSNDGLLEAFNTVGVSGSTLQYDGASFAAVEQTPAFSTGSAGGDLSGSYPFPKVVNVSNVTSGPLPVSRGGTGTDLSADVQADGGLLVVSSGSGRVISADPSNANSFIVTKGGKWGLGAVPSLYPNVQYFTSSGVWDNSHSASFARILIQGGGGSGGGGSVETTAVSPGGGGGSGGWADITVSVNNITGAIVTVGTGGASQTTPSTAGNAGGVSSFGDASMIQYVFVNGGSAGGAGSTTAAGGAGGSGGSYASRALVKAGVAGAAYNAVGTAGSDVSTGGGVGGSYAAASAFGPGTVNSMLGGNKNFGYNIDVTGRQIGKLIASGGVGANPTLLENNQSVLDPYALLHMEPAYERTVDVTTSSFMTYDVTLGGTAGAASFQNTVSRWGDYALIPRSGSTYGAAFITPGYNLGTGDFTAEFWLYLNSTGSGGDAFTRYSILDTRNGAALGATNYSLATTTVGNRLFFISSTQLSGSSTVTAGQWHHVAYVRQSGILSIYLNGSRETSGSFANNFSTATNICLGNLSSTSTTAQFNVDGYIDNFRLSNSARYSGETYTVPTEKFTNDGNTIVLVAPTSSLFSPAETSIPTAQSYNPVISYNGSAGFTNEKPNFPGDYSLKPWKYSINGSYNTGSITVTPGYNLGTADFTAEAWVWLNSTGSNFSSAGTRMFLYDTRNNAGSTSAHAFVFATNGKLGMYNSTGASLQLTSSLSVPTGSWQHIAMTRQNNVFRFYINGQQDVNTYTTVNSFSEVTRIIVCGSGITSETQYSLNGYINNFRITKGAQYTSSYTPPTAPFVRDNNTVVLINNPEYDKPQTTRTVDSSYHGRTVTFSNTATLIQTASAFGDTGYVLSPKSGSGTAGWMSVTPGQALGTGDFTAECWLYLNNYNPSGSTILDTRNAGATSTSTFVFDMGFTGLNAGKLGFFNNTAYVLSSSVSVPTGSWQHIALVRNNNVMRMYINGVQNQNSASFTNSLSDVTNIRLGNSTSAGATQYFVDGYIDEFRITPKALYTTPTYTVPTARFSNPYNPLLLLHMEPSGSSKTATVDSSIWNTNVTIFSGSIQSSGSAFSNTGNSLVCPSSGILTTTKNAIGTRAFTYEMWVKLTSYASVYTPILDTRSSLSNPDGILIYIDAEGKINGATGGTGNFTGNRIVPLNVWTHIAIVRHSTSAGGTFIYINGIKDTTNITFAANATSTKCNIGVLTNTGLAGYKLIGYIDEVRLTQGAIYSNSHIQVPSEPFLNPSKYSFSNVASGKPGQFGSGGGGGASTFGPLQAFNGGYISGKGGDGYVVVISW